MGKGKEVSGEREGGEWKEKEVSGKRGGEWGEQGDISLTLDRKACSMEFYRALVTAIFLCTSIPGNTHTHNKTIP